MRFVILVVTIGVLTLIPDRGFA